MQSKHRQQSIWLVLSVLVMHLLLAPFVPLGVDEAHYALYGLHLDLSYFDHPPLVGWLQFLPLSFGLNEFTVRLMPAILYAVSSWLAYRLTFILFPKGSACQGWVAVCLLNLAPILQLMGWGMVPDLPLMVVGLLAVELLYKIHTDNQLKHWILLGVVYGFAGLSKYTAVFLPLGLVLFLTAYQGLKWLKQPGPWVAAVIAFILISPVLIWNMNSDWASLAYQFDRGVGVKEWELKEALAMQVVQMLLYGILAYVAAVGVVISLVRKTLPEEGRVAAWAVVCSALPALLVISWSAGDGTVLPNWPALCWTLLAPLSAYWICLNWGKRWLRVLAYCSSGFSAALILFLFAFLAFMPLSTFPFMKGAIKDLVGWKEASLQAVEWQNTISAEVGSKPVLMVGNWTHASRIAWYTYPEPVQLQTDRMTQFDFWHGEPDANNEGLLMLNKKPAVQGTVITYEGFTCQHLENMDTTTDGVLVNQFQFYHCKPQ